MSAYGTVTRTWTATFPLSSTIWTTSANPQKHITIHHLRLDSAPPELVKFLSTVFAEEVADGRTYPQEGFFDLQAFENYFLAEDLLVGILTSDSLLQRDFRGSTPSNVMETTVSIDEARNGRTWEECVIGCYYVKPNYPGRSSHICNAGFLVPPIRRKGGFGSILAKSYLHYAPKLGYRASVFNLVYVNNDASMRLWERLGFTKVGRIPQAGRLRRKDGKGEEYVDALVVYKSFIDEEQEPNAV
ncbi:hypothetical protein EV360DRAFT_33328 [Lentinula raphanica]|nr:hypothetical protein EV360DRAFT_33328 [Lentinula raphanica]